MTVSPPTATLFPYTTLFRSERNESPISIDRELAFAHERPRVVLLDASRSAVEQEVLRRVRHERLRNAKSVEPQRIQTIEDRKSTRLNSSHITNTYAVV